MTNEHILPKSGYAILGVMSAGSRMAAKLLDDLAGKPDVDAWGAPVDLAAVGRFVLTALKWLGLALAGFAYLVALVFLLAVAADFVGAL